MVMAVMLAASLRMAHGSLDQMELADAQATAQESLLAGQGSRLAAVPHRPVPGDERDRLDGRCRSEGAARRLAKEVGEVGAALSAQADKLGWGDAAQPLLTTWPAS